MSFISTDTIRELVLEGLDNYSGPESSVESWVADAFMRRGWTTTEAQDDPCVLADEIRDAWQPTPMTMWTRLSDAELAEMVVTAGLDWTPLRADRTG